MTVDVSAANAKERAARFAASFDPGPPGHEHTRRQLLSTGGAAYCAQALERLYESNHQ